MKKLKEFVTDALGFKVKLFNVPTFEFEGEEHPDIDFAQLAETVFFDLLRSDIRLTGNQLRFLRKHLRLRQEDMKRLVGIEQSNWARLEAKEDTVAFESDSQLLGVKSIFLSEKLSQEDGEATIELKDIVHPVENYKDPDSTFIGRVA